jgi:hypothetical protein
MVKVIQETCHAKEIEHFRLLGSYFGNAIKQKKTSHDYIFYDSKTSGRRIILWLCRRL